MLLVWLGEVVCDVFFIVGLGNEDKMFFLFFGERICDKTMEDDEEEGEGREKEREGRRDVVVIGQTKYV